MPNEPRICPPGCPYLNAPSAQGGCDVCRLGEEEERREREEFQRRQEESEICQLNLED